jgi:phage tail sheath protein FI
MQTPVLNTPNVYIQEINVFPPSVAEVSTAVPAFIGYTQLAKDSANNDLTSVPTRIASFLEYKTYFGYAFPHPFTVQVDANYNVLSATPGTVVYYMYYALQMYFANGGGPCYIVSIGTYESDGKFPSTAASTTFDSALDALTKEDEPTIIVVPDALNLVTSDGISNYISVCQKVLAHCALYNRFAILDLPQDITDTVTNIQSETGNFRNNLGTQNLAYGAAYTPYLLTTLPYYIDNQASSVSITGPGFQKTLSDMVITYSGPIANPTVIILTDTTGNLTNTNFDMSTAGKLLITIPSTATTVKSVLSTWDATYGNANPFFQINGDNQSTTTITNTNNTSVPLDPNKFYQINVQGIVVTYIGQETPSLVIKVDGGTSIKTITFSVASGALTITTPSAMTSPAIQDILNAWNANGQSSIPGFQLNYDGSTPLSHAIVLSSLTTLTFTPLTNFSNISVNNTTLSNNILSAINASGVTLPPSSAMAGIYCEVDNKRGVWKAPANVSVSSVIGPTVKLSNDDQAVLNVDTSGISINAIRSFTGKGTLVWGSRTLAGNDNNWRYIPVRRLLSIIELSLQNATAFAIFEPNTAMTWLKVRTMTESFLEDLWKQGALAGSKPEQAFFVNVGLGTTMTATDILNGVMIIEVGVAAAHPAEFIILRISQMLQQS